MLINLTVSKHYKAIRARRTAGATSGDIMNGLWLAGRQLTHTLWTDIDDR